MRSAMDLDPGMGATSDVGAQELLVMWQHPVTREIIPIGRFSHSGDRYSFAYTRAAEGVRDFRPLVGLPDIHVRYNSERMPAVFNQRVMSPDRPDYGPYLATLGLTTASGTPWEQIVQSGGSRAGDTLQFMPMPSVVGGRARARFLVNGIRHVPDEVRSLPGRRILIARREQEAALRGLKRGDQVLLEPESGNPIDPDAVMITAGGIPVGWVPRALSSSVRELIGAGCHRASVHRIGDPLVSSHLRLVLDLDVPAPAGFAFDREGRWSPLAG